MSSQTLDQLVERVDQLPRLPDTAVRLVNIISDPGSSIEEIVDTIRYDQAVTADVLRLCNSAFFGLSRRVNSIDDAILMLGTAKVLQLVLSTHVQTVLRKPQEGYGLLPGALWEHSVGVALASRLFAQRFGLGEVGLSFTIGLLHDVGKVVMNKYITAEYTEIVRRVTEERSSFLEAEQQVVGFTHPEVGARLAETWSLPEELIRCIRYHHDPEELTDTDALVDAVHLADVTCLLIGIGGGEVDGLAYRAQPTVMERRELGLRDLETIGADVVIEVKSVRELFAANG